MGYFGNDLPKQLQNKNFTTYTTWHAVNFLLHLHRKHCSLAPYMFLDIDQDLRLCPFQVEYPWLLNNASKNGAIFY